MTSQNEKTTLLGKTKQDYASILRWMSFGNTEVIRCFPQWYFPLVGTLPYNKKDVEEAGKKLSETLDVLEKHLLVNTFFVGERLTLADLFMAGMVFKSFKFFLGEKERKQFPCLTRHFETVTNQSIWTEACEKPSFATEQTKNQAPPKQETAPKKEKAAAKPAAAAKAADEEEEDKPAPKPKHPLEALSKPTLILDDWKRKYSNEETREVALPWFWENFKSDEYSLWQVDYKYNDELTMVFMTSNLLGESSKALLI